MIRIVFILEWNRDLKRKDFISRARYCIGLKDLQDLATELDFLGISCRLEVGKSTLCIMFMTWLMGKRPDAANVMSRAATN